MERPVRTQLSKGDWRLQDQCQFYFLSCHIIDCEKRHSTAATCSCPSAKVAEDPGPLAPPACRVPGGNRVACVSLLPLLCRIVHPVRSRLCREAVVVVAVAVGVVLQYISIHNKTSQLPRPRSSSSPSSQSTGQGSILLEIAGGLFDVDTREAPSSLPALSLSTPTATVASATHCYLLLLSPFPSLFLSDIALQPTRQHVRGRLCVSSSSG